MGHDPEKHHYTPGGDHDYDKDGQKLPHHREHLKHEEHHMPIKEKHHEPKGEMMGGKGC